MGRGEIDLAQLLEFNIKSAKCAARSIALILNRCLTPVENIKHIFPEQGKSQFFSLSSNCLNHQNATKVAKTWKQPGIHLRNVRSPSSNTSPFQQVPFLIFQLQGACADLRKCRTLRGRTAGRKKPPCWDRST